MEIPDTGLCYEAPQPEKATESPVKVKGRGALATGKVVRSRPGAVAHTAGRSRAYTVAYFPVTSTWARPESRRNWSSPSRGSSRRLI